MLQRAFVVQAIGIAAALVLSGCGAHLTSGLDLTNAPAPEPKPAPPACSMEDLSGCETGAAVTLRGVNFDFGKASLTAEAQDILGGVAATLKARTELRVEIAGHTDAVGPEDRNQILSERRAQAVVSYLAGLGVAPSRLYARGYGESMPIAGNDTAEGRERNRRVEMKVLAGAASAPVAAAVAAAPAQEPALAGAAVTIAGHSFAPASLTVAAGTTVTWINHEEAHHTVSFADHESGVLVNGGSYSHRFNQPGQYDYQCGYHSYMKGTVHVSG